VQELATNWASIYSNHGLISLSTSSGYRSSRHDPEGEHIVVALECENDILGQSLLRVLEKSRLLHPEEAPGFYDLANTESNYENFVSSLLHKFGDMSRRKAFTKMLHCSVSVRSGEIIIKPSKKERGEAWSGSGFNESDDVHLPHKSSAAEIGVAIKSVLEKCK
jgi:hypothetical protein